MVLGQWLWILGHPSCAQTPQKKEPCSSANPFVYFCDSGTLPCITANRWFESHYMLQLFLQVAHLSLTHLFSHEPRQQSGNLCHFMLLLSVNVMEEYCKTGS